MVFVLFLVTNLSSSLAQTEGCECEDQSVTICYLPDDIYCYADLINNACGYSLDGDLMEEYLAAKLLNSNNFGLDGIVKCPLDLQPLTENISIEYLEEQKCDIVFTGNFIIDTLTFESSGDITSLSEDLLTSIREWSLLCESNLVITSQKEAGIWGYNIENENVNPNLSSTVPNGFNIFDGPFGNVPSFNQGGTYQGVITEEPASGFTILAVDSNNRPTVVIDELTNDLIFGDIGIFCGGAAGTVSFGENINNNNDRLISNIFALGCFLAGSSSTTENITLCPGQDYMLPSGTVVQDEGNYIDTLVASNFCDSIVMTSVILTDTLKSEVSYSGCLGDNFFYEINETIYDEDNRVGTEYIETIDGCDSLVSINLVFESATNSFIQNSFCEGDDFELIVGSDIFNKDRLTGEVMLQNVKGCDSIVTVELTMLQNSVTNDYFQICGDEELTVEDVVYTADIVDTFTYQNTMGCDSLYIVHVNTYDSIPDVEFQESITLTVDVPQEITIPIESDYDIIWSPESAVTCDDCTTTSIIPDVATTQIEYIVTDSNLCERTFTLNLEYICPVYVPNAIVPYSSNSDNSSFKLFSNCDLSENYNLKIFNRWGGLIFETNNPNDPWTGQSNGKIVDVGVYVFMIDYTFFGKTFQKVGDITVLK